MFVPAALLTAPLAGRAQLPVVEAGQSPAELIKTFTNKESELLEVWKEYAYQQESRLQVLGPANIVSGELYELSEFVFNDAGKRVQRILRAPASSLSDAGLTFTSEDRKALIELQPFALTAETLPDYSVSYVGKEKVDELNTHVFDVTPKVMNDKKRLEKLKDQKVEGAFFQGRIWVDDQDMQVVKVKGKVVPEFKQRFPLFETYRENIDQKFWFPTYTYADDTLVFEKGFSVHLKMVVKYKNYRRFSSDVKVLTGEEEKPEEKPKKP